MFTAPPIVDLPNPRAALSKDPAVFLATCQERYGSVFTLPFETPVTYMLDASAYRAVLTSTQVNFAPISRQSKRRFQLGALVELNLPAGDSSGGHSPHDGD